MRVEASSAAVLVDTAAAEWDAIDAEPSAFSAGLLIVVLGRECGMPPRRLVLQPKGKMFNRRSAAASLSGTKTMARPSLVQFEVFLQDDLASRGSTMTSFQGLGTFG